MASPSESEAIPLDTIHEDVEKDDFPLLSRRDAASLQNTQRLLQKTLSVFFIASVIMGIASCAAVMWREFLEYNGFDDRDRGSVGTAPKDYSRRDWPVMAVMLLGILLAAFNLSQMRRNHRPIHPLINIGVLSTLLLMICFAGFGMVPWQRGGDRDVCDEAHWPKSAKVRMYYRLVCGNLKTYHWARRLDMVYVDIHAFINLTLLVLNIWYHFSDRRSAGEGLAPREVTRTWGPMATRASQTLALTRELCVQAGKSISEWGASTMRDLKSIPLFGGNRRYTVLAN